MSIASDENQFSDNTHVQRGDLFLVGCSIGTVFRHFANLITHRQENYPAFPVFYFHTKYLQVEVKMSLLITDGHSWALKVGGKNPRD